MKITEDQRNYAAKQGLAEKEALAKGLAERTEGFMDKGAEVCAMA